MGADMLAAVLFHKGNLDFDAGLATVRSIVEGLEPAALEEALDEIDAQEDADGNQLDQLTAALTARLTRLRASFEEHTRDVTDYYFDNGVTLTISGGLSWGDGPTDTFDAIAEMTRPPGGEQVLEACGFFWPTTIA